VAILDADKEGFLRSHRSLIQTAGRAARNVNSTVIMYADQVTASMRSAIDEMERRRRKQQQHNRDYQITPQSVRKRIQESLESVYGEAAAKEAATAGAADGREDELQQLLARGERACEQAIRRWEKEMEKAARLLDFERAAELRDKIKKLRTELILA